VLASLLKGSTKMLLKKKFTNENDTFSYRQLLMQLSEMKDNLDSEDVMSLLTKIIEVQLPKRKISLWMTRLPPMRLVIVWS